MSIDDYLNMVNVTYGVQIDRESFISNTNRLLKTTQKIGITAQSVYKVYIDYLVGGQSTEATNIRYITRSLHAGLVLEERISRLESKYSEYARICHNKRSMDRYLAWAKRIFMTGYRVSEMEMYTKLLKDGSDISLDILKGRYNKEKKELQLLGKTYIGVVRFGITTDYNLTFADGEATYVLLGLDVRRYTT